MENQIDTKAFAFAVRTVNLYKHLKSTSNEFDLFRQVLRSGTSIGANVAESQQAQSRADFISKLEIALKETTETKYWLRLMKETGYLSESEFESIFSDCAELEKILVRIIKSTKN